MRDALAAFLIGTGPLAFFSGPYGWQISQARPAHSLPSHFLIRNFKSCLRLSVRLCLCFCLSFLYLCLTLVYAQSWSDPTGIEDIRRRWLPEFDKPLGEAKGQPEYLQLRRNIDVDALPFVRARVAYICYTVLSIQPLFWSRYDKATNLVTREFASGTKVTFNHSNNQGTIEWGDGTTTKGPGCAPAAKSCQQCDPPDYKTCHGHPD